MLPRCPHSYTFRRRSLRCLWSALWHWRHIFLREFLNLDHRAERLKVEVLGFLPPSISESRCKAESLVLTATYRCISFCRVGSFPTLYAERSFPTVGHKRTVSPLVCVVWLKALQTVGVGFVRLSTLDGSDGASQIVYRCANMLHVHMLTTLCS